jgi:hypothetical protein
LSHYSETRTITRKCKLCGIEFTTNKRPQLYHPKCAKQVRTARSIATNRKSKEVANVI